MSTSESLQVAKVTFPNQRLRVFVDDTRPLQSHRAPTAS
jgi:hypothetical protein